MAKLLSGSVVWRILCAIGVWLAMVGDWVVRLICFVLRARKKLWLEHR